MLGLALQNRLQIKSTHLPDTFYYVDLDGDDDEISLPISYNSYLVNDQDFSASAWIKTASDAGSIFGAGHISLGGVFRWNVYANNKHYFYWKEGSTTHTLASSSALTPNVWTHVGFTHDQSNNEVKLYINGSLDSTHSATLTGAVYDNAASIGAIAEGAGNIEMEGGIANFALFNDILTAGEMANLNSNIDYNAASLSNCIG